MKKNINRIKSSLRIAYSNYSKNQPVGIKELELLFSLVKKTKWYKMTLIKIILINLSIIVNKQEKLLKQKIIFMSFFSLHYNFNYSYIIINHEFNEFYNKWFTLFKFIKPY